MSNTVLRQQRRTQARFLQASSCPSRRYLISATSPKADSEPLIFQRGLSVKPPLLETNFKSIHTFAAEMFLEAKLQVSKIKNSD